ncbi:unnamed protein product [Heterotrigona itama]|uniref:Uncharacterized protein n=1 Tax=Heterotrigona itama TaxID=395501 RepID=A0A6V7HLR5_9HYME|nr:unnamed protein product [Heterotrigona itama]
MEPGANTLSRVQPEPPTNSHVYTARGDGGEGGRKCDRKYDAEGDEIWNRAGAGLRSHRRREPMINGNIRRYNAPSHRKPVKYDSRPITRVQKHV